MYGCSDAVLVYGFNIGDREYIIDYKYLEDKFPGISEYAADVVRNILGEAVYGISCGLDEQTGQVIISDEEKQKVKILYIKYIEYLKNELSEENFKNKMKEIKLCFRLVVSGDYEICQDTIILDEDWEAEDEEAQDEAAEDEDEEVDFDLRCINCGRKNHKNDAYCSEYVPT